MLGAASEGGAKERRWGSLFKHETILVSRILRGHWERGWQEGALWEMEKSFCVAVYNFGEEIEM